MFLDRFVRPKNPNHTKNEDGPFFWVHTPILPSSSPCGVHGEWIDCYAWWYSHPKWRLKEETQFVRIELGDCSKWNASNRTDLGMAGGSIFEKCIDFRVLGHHNGAWKLFQVPSPLNVWFRLMSKFLGFSGRIFLWFLLWRQSSFTLWGLCS